MKNRPMTINGTLPVSSSTAPMATQQAGVDGRAGQPGDSGPAVPLSGNPGVSADVQPAAPAVMQYGFPTGSQAVSQPEAVSTNQRTDPGASPTSTFDPLVNGPRPPALEARLAYVATIADPHMRDHVEANVRLQTHRQVMAFTEAQRQAKAQAKQVIDQGGDLATIPAKLMLQIDVPGRMALRDYTLAHANPSTDLVTYYGLKNQALDDPVAFQSIDLANYMASLKPADYAELNQLQSSLNDNQPPADLPLQRAYKANTDRLLQQLGLPTGLAGSSDVANDNMVGARQTAVLRQAIDQYTAATEIATGRKLTPAEHRDMSADVSNQFQQLSGNSQKNSANDNALTGKSAVADSDINVGVVPLAKEGQASAAVQHLASSLGELTAAECRSLCSELALASSDYGTAFYRCVLACVSEGQSGFPDWDTHF